MQTSVASRSWQNTAISWAILIRTDLCIEGGRRLADGFNRRDTELYTSKDIKSYVRKWLNCPAKPRPPEAGHAKNWQRENRCSAWISN